MMCAGKFHSKHHYQRKWLRWSFPRVFLHSQHHKHYKSRVGPAIASALPRNHIPGYSLAAATVTVVILLGVNTERNGSKECEERGKGAVICVNCTLFNAEVILVRKNGLPNYRALIQLSLI